MSSLDRLPDGWAVMRDDDHWEVGIVETDCCECGHTFDELAWGKTIDEAIALALAEYERREQRRIEREADYKRRKADGKLTCAEQINEMIVRNFQKAAYQSLWESARDTGVIEKPIWTLEAAKVESNE